MYYLSLTDFHLLIYDNYSPIKSSKFFYFLKLPSFKGKCKWRAHLKSKGMNELSKKREQ